MKLLKQSLIDSKGDLMKLIYSEQELIAIDTAIPIAYWKSIDTSLHVMNYNEERIFGKLENMIDIAQKRNIQIKTDLKMYDETGCYPVQWNKLNH